MEMQRLLDEAQTLIEIGDEFMFTIDIPYVPLQESPVVLAQSMVEQPRLVAPITQRAARANYLLTDCQEIPEMTPSSSAQRAVDPAGAIDVYITNRGGKSIRPESATVTLIEKPKHGVLTEEVANTGYRFFGYDQNPGFVGKDRAVFLVEAGGERYKVVVTLAVTVGAAPDIPSPCPPARLKKLSDAGVRVSFTDLPGSSLGQTTGSTIALDTNAAGHGWFIDYTPYLNEEYLPTSNPNLWVAKEGSEAAGKMDLLSVLLHEYGHALGIEHSANSGDYMAATLQPGVRRLPSSEELTLMARLVAEAKASYEVAAVDEVPQPGVPLNPNQPGAPLPNRNGNVRTTRARISRFGTTILNADGSEAPQYSIVANPTLTDAKLQTGSGWETQGNVAIGNGAAVLSESTTRQTRLNQVFTVGPNDRYLSFTLADIVLDDIASGPDDAFEVGLLNADTGASLAGATGLSRNDAFLNLQANGTEFVGQGVTSTRNADGSRTYRVDLGDLSGIPEGTAVNLSFDLIGFAAATSHVTVRDIRLGVPETRDDAVTTAEDTPFDIAALGNDVDASLPGFAPVVVAAPAHGQVSLNADGSFRYVPLADWSGEDSFTYKLSDGAVESNVATVRVTVTPVNDAPVAGDRSASTSEDTPLTLDLLAGASDIDSVALTATIVTGPRHGLLTQNADGTWTYRPAGITTYFGAPALLGFRLKDFRRRSA